MTTDARLRLAEPLAALSLVTDLGVGYPAESAIRATLLATLLAERMGVSEDERRNVDPVATGHFRAGPAPWPTSWSTARPPAPRS